MAVYPLPDYEGRLWSQWGQGVVLEDGRILSAVGDHDGTGGNSFFYELDPASGRLTLVGDVLSAALSPMAKGVTAGSRPDGDRAVRRGVRRHLGEPARSRLRRHLYR